MAILPAISAQLDAKTGSLLLHLPILLGINMKYQFWNVKTTGEDIH